jgi:hypothetical protein
LIQSEKQVDGILAADRAAAEGREFYDDAFFAAFFKGARRRWKSGSTIRSTASPASSSRPGPPPASPALALDTDRPPARIIRR